MMLFSINNDDQTFLTGIYSKYYPIMIYTAKKLATNNTAADDIVQSAILKLVRYLDTLRTLEENALITYLVYTVQSEAVNSIRAKSKRIKLLEKVTIQFPLPLLPEQELEKKQLQGALKNALWNLKDRDRDLLIYRYYLELDYAIIAKILDINPANIRVYMERARKRALLLLKDRGISHVDE